MATPDCCQRHDRPKRQAYDQLEDHQAVRVRLTVAISTSSTTANTDLQGWAVAQSNMVLGECSEYIWATDRCHDANRSLTAQGAFPVDIVDQRISDIGVCPIFS